MEPTKETLKKALKERLINQMKKKGTYKPEEEKGIDLYVNVFYKFHSMRMKKKKIMSMFNKGR